MKTQLLIVAVLLAGLGSARADDTGQGWGPGMKSCGQFAKDYAQTPTLAEGIYFAWAQGFMSGLNVSSALSKHVYQDFSGGDMDGEKARIRAYCDTRPLAQYMQAVMDLYLSFPTKVAKSN